MTGAASGGSGSRPVASATPADRRPARPVPALLAALDRDHLDPGYAAAAARRAGSVPPDRGRRVRSTVLLAVAVLIVGVLFGVAAQTTDLNAVGAERARSALLADIERAREHQDVLASSAAALAEELAATQSALGVDLPSSDAAQLALAAGSAAVHGPGVRVVIGPGSPPSATTDAAGSQAQRTVIADRDIQLVVNGLWAAGAEAVTVGGVRLRPTSAVRQAGGAILVDNSPVFFPITVEAIGDPNSLPAQFALTSGFGRFNSFAQLYGIQFDLSVQDDLVAPAGTGPDLRFAGPTGSVDPSGSDGAPSGAPGSVPAGPTTPAPAGPGGAAVSTPRPVPDTSAVTR